MWPQVLRGSRQRFPARKKLHDSGTTLYTLPKCKKTKKKAATGKNGAEEDKNTTPPAAKMVMLPEGRKVELFDTPTPV